MQSCLDRKWAKAAACYGRDKKEAAVVEDRAALQQSQLMFFATSLTADAMTAHASRIALAAYGATSSRVVGERTARHVSSGRSRGGG